MSEQNLYLASSMSEDIFYLHLASFQPLFAFLSASFQPPSSICSIFHELHLLYLPWALFQPLFALSSTNFSLDLLYLHWHHFSLRFFIPFIKIPISKPVVFQLQNGAFIGRKLDLVKIFSISIIHPENSMLLLFSIISVLFFMLTFIASSIFLWFTDTLP